MARAANALPGDGDGTRRANLAHEINAADVNAKFEGRGCDKNLDFAGFKLAFCREAQAARQASVVRRDGLFAETVGQVVSDALGEPARIYKNESRAMLAGQVGKPIVDFVPFFVRRDGAEWTARNFDGDVELAGVTDFNDLRARSTTARQKRSNLFNWFLRSGEADSNRRLGSQGVETLERQRKVRAALVVCNSVDFVHDHRLDGAKVIATLACGKQDVQRLGSRHQNVRRAAEHFAPSVRMG